MFSLFRKKSGLEALQKTHKKLLEESFRLSTISRIESDKKMMEADNVMRRIMELKELKG